MAEPVPVNIRDEYDLTKDDTTVVELVLEAGTEVEKGDLVAVVFVHSGWESDEVEAGVLFVHAPVAGEIVSPADLGDEGDQVAEIGPVEEEEEEETE